MYNFTKYLNTISPLLSSFSLFSHCLVHKYQLYRNLSAFKLDLLTEKKNPISMISKCNSSTLIKYQHPSQSLSTIASSMKQTPISLGLVTTTSSHTMEIIFHLLNQDWISNRLTNTITQSTYQCQVLILRR